MDHNIMDSQAGRETDRIMGILASKFNPDALMKNVDTHTYNRLWSIILEHNMAQEKRDRALCALTNANNKKKGKI